MQVPKNLQKIPWVAAGYRELGVGRYGSVGAHGKAVPAHDTEGHILNNPRILEYFAATATKKKDQWTESNAWCSAFVNWCMRQSGIVGTHAMARSWLHWHNGEKLDQPRIGAVVVFPRPRGGDRVVPRARARCRTSWPSRTVSQPLTSGHRGAYFGDDCFHARRVKRPVDPRMKVEMSATVMISPLTLARLVNS